MKFYRIPTKQEEQLIELLVHKSSLKMSEDWKNGLLVCPMDDGCLLYTSDAADD